MDLADDYFAMDLEVCYEFKYVSEHSERRKS